MKKTVVLWVAFLFVFTGLATLWVGNRMRQRAAEQVRLQTLQTVADESWRDKPLIDRFVLTERSGAPFESAAMRGRVWVASFFFTACPSICVKQNEAVAELAKEFGPQGVTFVSITCDPTNDSPEVLAQYARRFGADPEHWLFLTGDDLLIRRVGAELFRVAVAKETHGTSLMVVDKQGAVRERFDWKEADGLANMRAFLQQVLAEPFDPSKPLPEPVVGFGPAPGPSEPHGAEESEEE